MTHTAGYCYNIWNAEMGRYMEHAGIPGVTTCENKALTMPLVFDPGERWEYGINIDWVGKAVEAASGQAARCVSQGPHLRAARHDRHRLQARPPTARAPRRHACARRGRRAHAGAVRDGAGAGIPHGRRRALRHRAGLHPLRAHAAQRRRARRQPRAQARDRQDDGREPHRRSQCHQDDDRDSRGVERFRSVARPGQEMGPELHDQHASARRKAAAPAASPGRGSPTPISGSIPRATSAA